MSSPGFLPDGLHGGKVTQAESDRLHFLRNRPEVPMVDGLPVEYPPYQYRPYPAAIYGVWSDEGKRRALLDAARAYGLNLTNPLQREEAEAMVPPYDSKLVGNDQERQHWINLGWTDSPDDVEKARDRYLANVVAVAAAERAFDDQHMSEKARKEFHDADAANGDEHLLDLPVPKLDKKRGPGRPRKVTE